jgi:hypothetical protein
MAEAGWLLWFGPLADQGDVPKELRNFHWRWLLLFGSD